MAELLSKAQYAAIAADLQLRTKAFIDGEFRGADVHALIQLHGIRVDDVAVQSLRDGQRCAGFSDGGCPHDEQDRRLG